MLLLRTNFARSKKSPPTLYCDVYAGVWRCGRRRRSNCIANSPGNEIKNKKKRFLLVCRTSGQTDTPATGQWTHIYCCCPLAKVAL